MSAVDCVCAGVIVVDHLCAPIDHMPKPGELILADELPLSIGGCAANAAVDLVKAGVNVTISGCVGNDPFGKFATEFLMRAGVDTSGLLVRDTIGTSGTLIVNVKNEDRRFIHYRGANGIYRVEDIPWSLVSQCKVLYVGGFFLMPELAKPNTLVTLFRRARQHGIKTVLDVVIPGAGDYWPAISEVLSETDVFHCNNDEGLVMTGLAEPIAQAEKFKSAGANTVVVSLGEKGTIMLSGKSNNDQIRIRASAYPTNFVGGTGAGDAFDAGFITGMLRGEDMIGCLKWGSALGASCVRSISATESVFTRDQAEKFIAEHELNIEKI